MAAGVFGVPSLVIAGEVFQNLDAMPMAEASMRDAALFRAGEVVRLDALPVGVRCRTVA